MCLTRPRRHVVELVWSRCSETDTYIVSPVYLAKEVEVVLLRSGHLEHDGTCFSCRPHYVDVPATHSLGSIHENYIFRIYFIVVTLGTIPVPTSWNHPTRYQVLVMQYANGKSRIQTI